jgi:HK97 family phage major capsid protein
MFDVVALRRKHAALIAEAKAMTATAASEERDLTPEEITKFDALLDEAERLEREDIPRAERYQKQIEALSRPVTEPTRPAIGPAAGRPSGPTVFSSIGDQLLSIAHSTIAMQQGRSADPRLVESQHQIQAQLGMNVGQPSDGGFLLETQFTNELWQRVYNGGELVRRCFRVPIDDSADSVKINGMDETSRATGSRWGGVRAYWLAEAATITASQPHFDRLSFEPKKMAVLVYATGEMLRSKSTTEGIINQIVPQEITWMTEDAIFRGDGAGKPLGFLSSGAFIAVAAEGGQGADTIVAENVNKIWARMWARSRANAVWLYNQECEPELDSMAMVVGAGGQMVYMPSGGLADAPYGRLKGRPAIAIEHASALGDVGDIVCVDLSQYGLSDRGAPLAASSIHVQFLTDQVAFRFLYSVDGQSMWKGTLTPAYGAAANTLSPFVGLAAR